MSNDQVLQDLPSLDELDLGILATLRSDPRTTNTEIAKRLKTPVSTIGARLRRLERAGAMRIVAELDMAAFGYQIFALLAVQVAPEQVETAALQFSGMSEISGVVEMPGSHQLYVTVLARDLDDLSDLLERRIKPIKGIGNIKTTLSLRRISMATALRDDD